MGRRSSLPFSASQVTAKVPTRDAEALAAFASRREVSSADALRDVLHVGLEVRGLLPRVIAALRDPEDVSPSDRHQLAEALLVLYGDLALGQNYTPPLPDDPILAAAQARDDALRARERRVRAEAHLRAELGLPPAMSEDEAVAWLAEAIHEPVNDGESGGST